MAILDSELLWYRAENTSDTTPASNGGRIDFGSQSISGAANNLFPNVTKSQRDSGATHWRKVAIGVRNSANLTLIAPKVSIESGTPGDTHVLLYLGTHDDTQDEVSGRPYGYGTLAANAALSATSISVTTEANWSSLSAGDRPFQVGDTVRIDSRDTVAGSGDVDYLEIASVSYTGTALTIGLTSGLTHAYTAADGVHVASVIEPGDTAAGYSGATITNQTGSTLDCDPSGGNLIVPNVGAIDQDWTITITNGATGAFSLSGDTLGVVATGATGALLNPSNPDGGKYLQLYSVSWSGTPVTGDTFEFSTTPAAINLWYQRVTPIGADSIANDGVTVCIEGESA